MQDGKERNIRKEKKEGKMRWGREGKDISEAAAGK